MGKKGSINKIAAAAVYVNTAQLILIIAFLSYMVFGVTPKGSKLGVGEIVVFLIILLISVAVNYYLTFKHMGLILYNNRYNSALQETNSQLETLNNTLRSQRHDFMNHLQVVYSLMELDDYKEARDYIERVYSIIQKVNRTLRTSIPAVNALIQAKVISAERNDTAVRINITTSLDKLTIPPWEFCRIIGNLIDNAIYALQMAENIEHKELCIEMFEDLRNYGFRIRNNGPEIPADIIDRIFDSGFTTKRNRGEGMGLAISKEIMQQYNGEIKVISSPEFTEFIGLIPKSLELIE